jgi:ABC-type uncharacterized transport system ATPase subunit
LPLGLAEDVVEVDVVFLEEPVVELDMVVELDKKETVPFLNKTKIQCLLLEGN